MSENFNFFRVNCSNKSVCTHFHVNRYPTIKVFFQGKEIDTEPGRDLESLLEFVDKLNSKALINLSDKELLKDFKKNYGENSFILVSDNESSKLYKCFETLAEGKYKPLFYFAHINKENYDKELTGSRLIVIYYVTLVQ